MCDKGIGILLIMNSGDLGLSPMEVEKSLKEAFRFAQLWNCVLLLGSRPRQFYWSTIADA